MAIQTEVWARDIAEKLMPDNSFLAQAVDHTAYVENKTVHNPQSGANPTVVRNPDTFPLTAAVRTDTVADYNIDEYVSTPTVIRDIEEIETSYQKRSSVLMSHEKELNRQISDWMAYHWAPTVAGALVRTTGDDRTAFVSGATGNRKKITLDDWLSVKRSMDNQDVPDDGRRFALVPAEMYNDMLEIDKVLSAEYNLTGRLPMGVINEIFGFKIFKRSYSASYSNAATPVLRTPGAAALTTANAAVIFWHADFVTRAKGAVKVYADEDNPLYTGSIFSVMARAGGRKLYTDGTGVVALVEAAGT